MKSNLSIGEVAKRCGLRTSTLRYYDRLGILPAAYRERGRRRYAESVFEKLAVISFARDSGFTLKEIRQLFTDGKPYSTRMRQLAEVKLQDTEALIERAKAMKGLLRTALRCECVDVAACGRRLLAVEGRTR